MALTKAFGAAFLYLRSFWESKASLHYETAEDRSLPEDFSETSEGQSWPEDFSDMGEGRSLPEDFSEMAEGPSSPEDFSETFGVRSSGEDSTEMTEVQSLPEDLIVKILVKLPVKSLLCCRCVCKRWSHLIKSTSFVKMHLDCQKSNDNFLMLCKCKAENRSLVSLHSFESPGFSFPFLDLLPLHLCGSCDGLVCLIDFKNNILILCNPVMREFRALPRFPFLRKDGLEHLVVAVGLGLSTITNDYKVIVIAMLIDNVNHRYEVKTIVFNLSTNSWREIPCNIPILMNWDFRGTLFRGAVHWIDWERNNHVSFDVNTEMFTDVELPCINHNEGSKRELMIFNGSLALVTYESPSESHCINIWVMHKYGVKESWTKQYTVGPVRGYFYPVLLWKNEAVILKDPKGELRLVSLGTHETNNSFIQAIQCPVEEVMVYSESLISIK